MLDTTVDHAYDKAAEEGLKVMVLPKTSHYTKEREAGLNLSASRRSRRLKALKEGEGAKVYFGGRRPRGAREVEVPGKEGAGGPGEGGGFLGRDSQAREEGGASQFI